MQRTPACILFILAAWILGSSPAAAQTASSAPPPASDAAFAAQKSAFLALPQSTRKAAQDALVWLGFYNGANDGDFGKRTRDSIVAYQLGQKTVGDGVLSAAQLQALMSAADKARATVGFEVVRDPKTGARIGAPTKLTAKHGGPKLDFASSADEDLAALYASLSAETPTRKIAYKAMKPGLFFVVSGQDGATKFYSRFEKGGGASPPIRGFTFAYPAAQATQLDRIAIAVANSFEAFPAAAQAPVASSATTPTAGGGPPAQATAPAATALVIGRGLALTALKPWRLPRRQRRRQAGPLRTNGWGVGSRYPRGRLRSERRLARLGSLAPDLVVLSAGADGITANAASLAGDGAKPLVIAALQQSASGGPAFDREGGLAGVVARIADEPKRVAGVALAAPHPIIGPEALRAFLAGEDLEPAPVAPEPLTAGAIAARERDVLVAVTCEK